MKLHLIFYVQETVSLSIIDSKTFVCSYFLTFFSLFLLCWAGFHFKPISVWLLFNITTQGQALIWLGRGQSELCSAQWQNIVHWIQARQELQGLQGSQGWQVWQGLQGLQGLHGLHRLQGLTICPVIRDYTIHTFLGVIKSLLSTFLKKKMRASL